VTPGRSGPLGPLVIGLDVSTTAAKAIVVDGRGTVLAEGRATFPLSNPGPLAWEQDASHWLEAALTSSAAAVSRLAPDARDEVVAIAIAHQRETFVVTDESCTPLAPAIVWMDGRSTPEVAAASREADPDWIHQKSGKVPCTTPALYKIRMLLERLRPDIDRRHARALDVHAFLVRHLTGELVTSTASADPLGLIDMQTLTFDADLAALARLDARRLPALRRPGEVIAPLASETLARLGLRRPVMLVAGAGDGQAAGLGTGVVEEGEAYLNVGTAVVAGVPSLRYRAGRSYRTLVSATGDYLLEMDLKGGTLTLDWLADRVLGRGTLEGTDARFQRLAALEGEAVGLGPGAGGLMALPYWAGVMNPHWDDDAGGALIGLRADHGPAHLYRAICEGLAFEERLGFELLERDTGRVERIVVTGGAMQRHFLLQLFASAMGRPLSLSSTQEATALGAALLAFPAAGLATEARSAARAIAKSEPATPPGPEAVRYRELYEGAYKRLFEALQPSLRVLSRSQGAEPASHS
jgi:xylulokinase